MVEKISNKKLIGLSHHLILLKKSIRDDYRENYTIQLEH